MSTQCQRLSFSASFSLFPCVCGCVELCGEREKQYRQGEVKKLSSEGQLATQGLIVFLSLPRRQKKGLFFLFLFQVKSLLLPPALSLSFSLVHTLAPFHILMPFKCQLFYMRYFVETENQEQSGLLSLWGDVGSRCITTPFLRLATAAVCHFSGN